MVVPSRTPVTDASPSTRAPLPAAVARLVAGERPLTARSVIASTLLGVDPPRLPTRLLVRSGELFGIADGTTRVALSRLAAAGDVEPDGDGYRLAGALLGRQARQTLSRQGARQAWNGAWELHVVVAADRDAAARSSMRAAAAALRLGERREGVWLRPDNLPRAHREAQPEAQAVLTEQCEHFEARLEGDPQALAAQLWDLEAMATRGRDLAAAVEALLPRLDDSQLHVLGPAFVVSAAALRWFQADPLLPAALRPGSWPGADLRSSYEAFDAAFKQAWRAWFRAQH